MHMYPAASIVSAAYPSTELSMLPPRLRNVSMSKLPRDLQTLQSFHRLLRDLPSDISAGRVKREDPSMQQIKQTVHVILNNLTSFIAFVLRDLAGKDMLDKEEKQTMAATVRPAYMEIRRAFDSPITPCPRTMRKRAYLQFQRVFSTRRAPKKVLSDMQKLKVAFEQELHTVETLALDNPRLQSMANTGELPSTVEIKDVVVDFSKPDVGSGSFGTVYKGEYQGQPVAIKKVHNDLGENLVRRRQLLLQEAEVLKKLQHDFITAFKGLYIAPDGAWCLVTEFVHDGDLRQRLYPKCTLTLLEKLDIGRDIAAGVWHLESNQIIHQDLKPPNVLLAPGPNGPATIPKLCDFGLASEIYQLRGGTRTYMAREQWLKEDADFSKVDVWAFGIMFNEMLAGERPWAHISERGERDDAIKEKIKEAILSGERPPLAKVPFWLTGCLKVVENCWQDDPGSRPTMKDVYERLRAERNGAPADFGTSMRGSMRRSLSSSLSGSSPPLRDLSSRKLSE